MVTILRTLIALKELKLYSACSRFNSPQTDIGQGFVHTDFTVKLSFIHTPTKEKFRITPNNHYSITHTLETAVNWYYDPTKNDMFFTEDGMLQFNYDYGNLYVNDSSDDGNHIEIRPTVDYSNSERGREGAVIYINNTDTQTVIARQELEAIFVVLRGFSFQNESILLLHELDRAVDKFIADGGKINNETNGQLYYI
jgi:hypothetical protein